jgi:hypothetical protein
MELYNFIRNDLNTYSRKILEVTKEPFNVVIASMYLIYGIRGIWHIGGGR